MYLRKIIAVFSVTYLDISPVSKAILLGIIHYVYMVLLINRHPFATKKLNAHADLEIFLSLFLIILTSFSYATENSYISSSIFYLTNLINAAFIFFSFCEIFKLKIFLLRKKLGSLKIFIFLFRIFRSKHS